MAFPKLIAAPLNVDYTLSYLPQARALDQKLLEAIRPNE